MQRLFEKVTEAGHVPGVSTSIDEVAISVVLQITVMLDTIFVEKQLYKPCRDKYVGEVVAAMLFRDKPLYCQCLCQFR